MSTPFVQFRRIPQLQLCTGAGASAGTLRLLAVRHKHRHADHGEAKPIRESATRVAPHHSPRLVIVHQLAEHACARQPRERTQVNGGFGMPAPREHAAGPRAQGYHVARARKVLCVCDCVGRRECAGSECAIMRRDPRRRACAFVRHHQRMSVCVSGGNVARTVLVVDRDGVCGPVPLLVLRDHHRDGQRFEAITCQRDADVPTV